MLQNIFSSRAFGSAENLLPVLCRSVVLQNLQQLRYAVCPSHSTEGACCSRRCLIQRQKWNKLKWFDVFWVLWDF